MKFFNKLWKLNQQFYYFFDIFYKNNLTKFLTNSSNYITFDNKKYLPYSNLFLTAGNITNSGQDYVLVEGNYETKGIENEENILDAKFIINLYYPQMNIIRYFNTYESTKICHNGLKFTLHLESIAHKLKQSMTKYYSTSCRACLGDKFCGVNKNDYTKNYNIINVNYNIIEASNIEEKDGYYDNGIANVDGNSFTIIKHVKNKISIINSLEKYGSVISLTAGCDKNFISCVNKFNNAINFRGEPFIPDMPKFST